MTDYELVIRPRSLISLRDLADVWRYRELLWTLASRDIRVRYKQALFGVLWALVQPLAQVVIFTGVFHKMAGIQPDAPVSYPLFIFSGTVIWTLFATALGQASNSLVENARVISKVYFPRVLVPLAAVVVASIDFLIAFALLLVALPLFGEGFHLSMLLLPIFALGAAGCAFAVSLWTSAINIQFRDVRYALPFVLQLLIFLTPVFYPSTLLPHDWRFLLALNPMAAIVDGFRAAMFGMPLQWGTIGVAFAVIAVVGGAGFMYFRKLEQTFADRL